MEAMSPQEQVMILGGAAVFMSLLRVCADTGGIQLWRRRQGTRGHREEPHYAPKSHRQWRGFKPVNVDLH